MGCSDRCLLSQEDPTCPLHRKDQRSDIRVVPPKVRTIWAVRKTVKSPAHSVSWSSDRRARWETTTTGSIDPKGATGGQKFTESRSLTELWTYQLCCRGAFLVHWVYVARESTESLGSPTGPVHRFDYRCDSVWRHQVRTIRAVQKSKEVAQARFLIPEKHMPFGKHRPV